MGEDWAVVIGITEYPALKTLAGPETDARAFLSWVTTTGGVPFDPAVHQFIEGQNQAVAVFTSDIKRKLLRRQNISDAAIEARIANPFESLDVAGPTQEEIERAFESLQTLSLERQKRNLGPRIGRRLYLYFAGHGIAPTKQDAAVLMANAMEGRFNKHIAGGAWADWFYEAGYFDETVLIMDCCREYISGRPLNGPFDEQSYPGRNERTKYYVYGAKWALNSFERKMDDGQVHGVLSYALLDGLRGKGCEPASGQVTATSLRTWLAKHMVEYLGAEDLANPDISKAPDIFPLDDPNRPLVFTTIPPSQIPVLPTTLRFPQDAVGLVLKIIDSSTADVIDERRLREPVLTLPLKIGAYVARIEGRGLKEPFIVRGRRSADVTFPQ